jgi:hypothetical protein
MRQLLFNEFGNEWNGLCSSNGNLPFAFEIANTFARANSFRLFPNEPRRVLG